MNATILNLTPRWALRFPFSPSIPICPCQEKGGVRQFRDIILQAASYLPFLTTFANLYSSVLPRIFGGKTARIEKTPILLAFFADLTC